MRSLPWLLSIVAVANVCVSAFAADVAFRSHPPMRPLPVPSQRPLGKGPSFFVDPIKGVDRNPGSQALPWKTLTLAIPQLKPGDTLYLRGGAYYESVFIDIAGTAEKPITIRSFPGELAIVDAGLREFLEDPAHAWEPVPQGADGEYRSVKAYAFGGHFGHFADSMVPLHPYLNLEDLRSANEFWHAGVAKRGDDPKGIYCGPGVRRDLETGRIYVRLAHTKLPGLGENAYQGETDPTKLPLVIAGHERAIEIRGGEHLRLQDLVIRGAWRFTIEIAEDVEDTTRDAHDIQLDGLTIYGGDYNLVTRRTNNLHVTNCSFRGHGAPWHSRAHHKYRAHAGYLVQAGGKDHEFANCTFTDHHDAVQFWAVENLKFHHNHLDNFNDDGFEAGPKRASGRMLVYQNVMTRCLSPFTLHGPPGVKPQAVESEQPGSGVYIFRNVIDMRQGTYRAIPTEPDPTGAYLNSPTEGIAHDHGSPLWPNYYVYHNTFLVSESERRGHYGFRWSTATRMTTRRVFNNIFVQVEGVPGFRVFPLADDDFQADGNLHWAVKEGTQLKIDPFEKFRKSPLLTASQKVYAPGWFAHDRFADPQFLSIGDGKTPSDLRLHKDSAAVNAGVKLPNTWPDDLREKDEAQPDVGAFPLGIEPWNVGPVVK